MSTEQIDLSIDPTPAELAELVGWLSPKLQTGPLAADWGCAHRPDPLAVVRTEPVAAPAESNTDATQGAGVSPGQPVKLCVALSLLLILAGCGESTPPQQGDRMRDSSAVEDVLVVKVKRLNGTEMECAIYQPRNGGGISCDWGAR